MSKICIIYGTNVIEMACTLLRQFDVAKRLSAGMNVVVKPNLVVAKPATEGAVTHPEIVEGIILFLKENGIHSITIAEGSYSRQYVDPDATILDDCLAWLHDKVFGSVHLSNMAKC